MTYKYISVCDPIYLGLERDTKCHSAYYWTFDREWISSENADLNHKTWLERKQKTFNSKYFLSRKLLTWKTEDGFRKLWNFRSFSHPWPTSDAGIKILASSLSLLRQQKHRFARLTELPRILRAQSVVDLFFKHSAPIFRLMRVSTPILSVF